MSLGTVSALPGEDHLRGGVINANDRTAHLVTSLHRGPRVKAEDGDGVVHMRRVPHHEFGSGGQRGRAELLTLPCAAQPQTWSQRSKGPRSKKEPPIVDEPLVTKTFGLKRVGDVLTQVGVARMSQTQRAPGGADHVSLLRTPVGEEAPMGRVVTESD